MGTLYDINKELLNFDYQFDEETGEMINAMELDSLELKRDEKVENICCFIKSLNADINALKDEMKALKDRADRKAKKIAGLKEYLTYCLNGETFDSARAEIRYRKSEEIKITGILDEDLWCRKKTTVEPDKVKIKKAIKNGEEVDGAVLVEKQNIQIK